MPRNGASGTGENGRMTAATDPGNRDEPDFCAYGSRYLLRLLHAFSREIKGVREGGDIEPVHRMRVASRRLRAALPLFSSCLPEKKYKEWFREVRRTTRALGNARDLDVQIDFLEQYRAMHLAGEPSHRGTGSPRGADTMPALDHLIGLLKERRLALQPRVEARLEELEECRVVEEMGLLLAQLVKKSKRTGKKKKIYPEAYREITLHLDLLLGLEPWVYVEDATEEQHRMRIAAKKLRYTMEIFAPVYGDDLKEPLKAVKRVQEELGAIHDCDVWIATLPEFMRSETGPAGKKSRPGQIPGGDVPDIAGLLEDRKRMRHELYDKFVVTWKSIRLEGILEGIPLLLSRYQDRK
jgi:CHAD domain-containing protein